MLTENEITIGLATILVFGIGAQWVARRTGIPSLLLLLPAGLLAGDVLGLVDPQELFGDLLTPLVTLGVSLLLFQSGTQLRVSDLPRDARRSVVRLVTIGVAITFAGATAVAAVVLDIPTELAFLTGAILVVSGPTVVGPMLDVVRPRRPIGHVLRWEGTALDPIGATLGVVILNLVMGIDRGGLHPVLQMFGRLSLGVAVGVVAATVLVFLMSRFLLTDDMEAAVALMLATAAFATAEVLLSEAGLFATVAMGVVVANQRIVSTKRIAGFGETLEVLIIGTLFVTLGALVSLSELGRYAGQIVLIVVVLVLVVRPATAALSLLGTSLPGRDRAMVGWMDPRGVVAAATATQFTTTLNTAGYDATFLLPVTFGVILGTGLVYGLTAVPVARGLGVAQPPASGVGLVGDEDWLRSFGRCLASEGVDTLVVTSQPLLDQRAEDSASFTAAALTDGTTEIQRLVRNTALAQVVVCTNHGDTLTLLEPDLIDILGRSHVLSVAGRVATESSVPVPLRNTGRAFAADVTRREIGAVYGAGGMIRTATLPLPDGAIVLAAIHVDGTVDLQADEAAVTPAATVIALIPARS